MKLYKTFYEYRLLWFSGTRATADELERQMLAVFGVLSLTGGTCLACATTGTRFERQIDIASGLLLVAGLSTLGAMLALFH